MIVEVRRSSVGAKAGWGWGWVGNIALGNDDNHNDHHKQLSQGPTEPKMRREAALW